MFKKQFKKRVLFVGIPDMAYICLDGLRTSGVNIVGVIGPKKNHPTYDNFKNFVQNQKLNFIEYDSLKDESFIKKVKDLNADIAVVCSFNYKVPKVLLEAVKGGFINVHPSLLPKYRGPNPYSAVILDGEKETGVTLHFMDEEFDTGDIILQKTVPLSRVETMGTLFNRTNLIAFEMLLETLNLYEVNKLPRQKQPKGQFPQGKVLPEEDLIIDYRRTACEINNLIRALNPFVLARTSFRGTMVKILSADILDNICTENHPLGAVVKIENDKFYLKTKEGLLAPTSMQFGSFFAGSSKEFISILNPKIGERFL